MSASQFSLNVFHMTAFLSFLYTEGKQSNMLKGFDITAKLHTYVNIQLSHLRIKHLLELDQLIFIKMHFKHYIIKIYSTCYRSIRQSSTSLDTSFFFGSPSILRLMC